MLTIEATEAEKYEFEYRGKVYRVTAASSLSIDDVLSFGDATAKGSLEQARWLKEFFSKETGGATDSMKVADFKRLANSWNGNVDMGESPASSD
jgi:hypothetical protein